MPQLFDGFFWIYQDIVLSPYTGGEFRNLFFQVALPKKVRTLLFLKLIQSFKMITHMKLRDITPFSNWILERAIQLQKIIFLPLVLGSSSVVSTTHF